MNTTLDRPRHPDLVRGYAICAVPRSGSNWLGQLLSSTDQLGNPMEYFNAAGRQLAELEYPDDPSAQIGRVLTDGCSSNGVYGLKVFPRQLDEVGRCLAWADQLPNLRLVRWNRRDLLGQAISRDRALQTRRWRGGGGECLAAEYRGEAILESLVWIATQNARWDVFFGRNGPPALSLCYEDATHNPQRVVDAFADMLGIITQPRINLSRIELEMQRDDQTTEWRRQFEIDYADLNYVDTLVDTH